ncbi:hypothetical protein B296_00034706 [Ensete ventricosum]|uniref:Uncharacterized protein n=1 Tax=Ensete ventricosum TaxID=4639 RepID=A0A427A7S6_ENSVE|nr:hypothetical protein B296_00034706 [Ensete ventricosum]
MKNHESRSALQAFKRRVAYSNVDYDRILLLTSDVCFAEMLVMGLTRLSWERVDVSIQRFGAHSVIQVLTSNHFCYHFTHSCFWFFPFYCEHSLATVVNLIIVVFFACWLSDRLRIPLSIQKAQMLYNI